MENPLTKPNVNKKPVSKEGELNSQELEDTRGGLSLNSTNIEVKNLLPPNEVAIFDDPFFFDVNLRKR